MKLLKKSSNPENINSQVFYRAYYSSNSSLPDIVCAIDSSLYQLSFNNSSYLIINDEIKNFKEAFEFQLNEFPPKNIVDLAHIASNAYKLDIQLNLLEFGIRGDKDYKLLIESIKLDDIILKAFALKNLSFKTLKLCLKLPTKQINILKQFISTSSFSLQELKRFVELLFDYQDEIIVDTYDKKYFSSFSPKSAYTRILFKDSFESIAKTIDNVSIVSKNQFETSRLHIEMTIEKPQEFSDKLEKLLKQQEKINQLYKVLKTNDLY